MTTWLVLGSSPLAPAAAEQAHAVYRPERTITANGGIRLFGHFATERDGRPCPGRWHEVSDLLLAMPPDDQITLWRASSPLPSVYFLSDQRACHLYRDAARAAQRLGTVCVTPYRDPSVNRYRDIPWFDQHEPLAGYLSLRLSGLFCAEYAAKHGATRVLLAGLDGYAMGKRPDNYFFVSPAHRQPYLRPHTQNVIPHTMLDLCEKYPAVEWVTIGDPLWKMARPVANWRVERIEDGAQTGIAGDLDA